VSSQLEQLAGGNPTGSWGHRLIATGTLVAILCHMDLRRLAAMLCWLSVATACGTPVDDDRPSTEGSTLSHDPFTRRVVDDLAGVSYDIPADWTEPQPRDLVPLLTTAAYSADPELASEEDLADLVLVGAGEFHDTFMDPSEEGLAEATWSVAASTAEFFFPNPGDRTELIDQAREVHGVQGWRVRLRVDFESEGDVPVTIDALGMAGRSPAFVFVIVQRPDPSESREVVERILGSVQPLEGR
jgi:hypothetical protein